jgi:DNA ligase-1
MISKPMLAVNSDLDKIKYPVLATEKLDGIRALVINGKAVSRNFKPIPNHYIRGLLEQYFEEVGGAVDGELLVKGNFNEVSSAIMSRDGRPDFTYCVFDYVKEDVKTPYWKRVEDMNLLPKYPHIKLLIPTMIESADHLLVYEEQCLGQGYEGVMIRSQHSPYKEGRSSVKEGYLLKIKRFSDAEAEVIGFEELLHNNNELKQDVFGHADRTSHKDNMIPGNTLGALKVRDIVSGVEFSVGTGLDQITRKAIWDNQHEYLNKIISYKHQAAGQKDLPRFPVFRGFRHLNDMS